MKKIIAPARCAECQGFGVDRAATCTAQYQPPRQGAPAGKTELLCDSCADNPWVYCNKKPLATVEVPAQCACGTTLPNWVDNGLEPTCIPCILDQADARRARDRRTLTKATGRTW